MKRKRIINYQHLKRKRTLSTREGNKIFNPFIPVPALFREANGNWYASGVGGFFIRL